MRVTLTSTSEDFEVVDGPATRRWRIAGLLTVILAVVLVAWGVWWLRHPTVFANAYGDAQSGHNEVGQTVLATVEFSPGVGRVSHVHIDQLVPRVVRNTSGGSIRFELCTLRPGAGGVGMDAGGLPRLNRYCKVVTPAVGADFSLVREAQELVMLYTPARAGLIQVAGVDMTYRAGWQKGTERVGVDTTLYVR